MRPPTPDHHLKRMRYVHQVFLLVGSILKNETIEGLQASDSVDQKDKWDASLRNESWQFAYWLLVLDPEMLHCRFVSSLREGELSKLLMNHEAGYLFLTKPITPVGFRFMWRTRFNFSVSILRFCENSVEATLLYRKRDQKFSLIPKDHSHEQTSGSAKVLQV